MSNELDESCLCVSEGVVEAQVVEDEGCVCGCLTTTVARYPALFEGMSFTRDEVEEVRRAGERRPPSEPTDER